MPTVGKKKYPYTKAGMMAANLAAAKSGKKVVKVATKKPAPSRMYKGGSNDFNELTGTYRSTGTKRPPNMPMKPKKRGK